MTVNQKIENAMKSLVGKNIWPLSKPTEDEPDKWCVYNPAAETPVDFGDDDDLAWVHNMQVHYFQKGQINYLPIRKQMRKLLKEQGFSLDNTHEDYESDTNITHVVVVCEIVEEDPYG